MSTQTKTHVTVELHVENWSRRWFAEVGMPADQKTIIREKSEFIQSRTEALRQHGYEAEWIEVWQIVDGNQSDLYRVDVAGFDRQSLDFDDEAYRDEQRHVADIIWDGQ